ncbi:MAG TPA: hypothetical protein VK137_00700, partial [Planctomycetaceae bacterium]|nr:hypothetical protein [Planctomycetaceae bacterium]
NVPTASNAMQRTADQSAAEDGGLVMEMFSKDGQSLARSSGGVKSRRLLPRAGFVPNVAQQTRSRRERTTTRFRRFEPAQK